MGMSYISISNLAMSQCAVPESIFIFPTEGIEIFWGQGGVL